MKREEYDEAMRLARAGGPKKSAWAAPTPGKAQKNPNEKEQYVKRSIFGSETRADGKAARKASRRGEW